MYPLNPSTFLLILAYVINGHHTKLNDINFNEYKIPLSIILLDNKESLQTTVLPISIDLMAGKGSIVIKYAHNVKNIIR